MTIIVIIAAIYLVCRLYTAAASRAQADRAERERRRIREEQAAIREQIRLDRENAREETRKRIEAEKARIEWQERQERINRQAQAERERMAKEQARLAEEQEKMRRVLDTATADIDFLRSRLADLDTRRDYLLYLQSATVPGGKEYDKYQAKIIALDNQIHTAEQRLNKAQYNRNTARRKLA